MEHSRVAVQQLEEETSNTNLSGVAGATMNTEQEFLPSHWSCGSAGNERPPDPVTWPDSYMDDLVTTWEHGAEEKNDIGTIAVAAPPETQNGGPTLDYTSVEVTPGFGAQGSLAAALGGPAQHVGHNDDIAYFETDPYAQGLQRVAPMGLEDWIEATTPPYMARPAGRCQRLLQNNQQKDISAYLSAVAPGGAETGPGGYLAALHDDGMGSVFAAPPTGQVTADSLQGIGAVFDRQYIDGDWDYVDKDYVDQEYLDTEGYEPVVDSE
ncbi:hypothetical protein VTK73DRAFT_6621 [Phialemonium thermophilum]|uniref:Uncharacterized protein n=1 Tax=Phialemonium thermophilum TaxID=223376 RepID=A0ABR3XV86_9PEZI